MSTFRCRDRRLDLTRTVLMGVVNVTPDSFSDGGRYAQKRAAVEQGLRLLDEGASVLDVGGESSRPGAKPVPLGEEIRRVIPVIEELAAQLTEQQLLSVDTCKPEVARAALEAGAHLVNDITGLGEPMLEVVAEFGAGGIAMHMQGEPRTMQENPRYDDVVSEVRDFLAARLQRARAHGVSCMLDPGIGFGKTLDQNLALLADLASLRSLGAPLLVGVSRKSMLGQLTGAGVDERLEATLGAHLVTAAQGADVLRVHDVLAHRRALTVAEAIWGAQPLASAPELVHVDALLLSCHIGVTEEERAVEQPLSVSLEFTSAARARDDALATTIDYAAVCADCRRFAAGGSWQLIETFAQQLGERLLALTGAAALEIRIDKPEAAAGLGAGSVGCTVRLRATGSGRNA
ncbi:MAG: dihydropteroate synthase [Acidobacteriota bacterium]